MGFADAFDGKATPKAAVTRRCTFCDLPLYLNLTQHPCCTFAEAAGRRTCEGCMALVERDKRPKRRGR